MNLDLTGKNAFVGGSSKGIGWASAVELANLGATVTLVARNEVLLSQKVKELPTPNQQKHDFVVMDFANFEETKKQIEVLATQKVYHILVNNTGGPSGGNILNEPTEKFERIFQQHLSINQLLVQAFFEGMKKANFGRIVNIISISVKQPIVGLGVSNTVRWAVASWAKTLSKEISQFGITVNNVLPGYTLTDRLKEVNQTKAASLGTTNEVVEKEIVKNIPIGRFAIPEEVAAAVAFLCSPAAASINGINIPVDGGLSNTL